MNKNKQNPPKIAEWIMYRLAREDDKTSLIEDIKEEYEEIVSEKGFKKAKFWYWKHVLRSIFPLLAFAFLWKITTFKNYFKIAYRNIIKYKWYSFISIAGLAVGMTLCILIFLFIRYELSYDRYHKNSGDIFRVVTRQLGNLYQGTDKWALTPGLLAPTLKSDFPEVINSTRVMKASGLISYRRNVFRESRIFYVDSDFLEIFFFPYISGNPKSALTEPLNVLITMDTAKKYFGNEDPIGKTIRLDNLHDLTVKGILKNVPGNTHFRFDFLVSFITVNSFDWAEETGPNTWSSLDFFTYIRLQKNSNPVELEKKFTAFERKYQGENGSNKFLLQPITTIHLYSNLNNELESNSDIRYIYIFSAIALLIMAIAAFNHMNLSTARSATRAKEVGIRKVVGAQRKDLIKQFLSESMLFSLLALLLSLFLVELFLPLFNSLIEKKLELGFTLFNDGKVLLFLASFFILTGLISGFYPSIFLSSIHPIKILKGTFMLDLKNPSGFRNPLVVFQFILSIVLVTCTIVINNQLDYIKGKEPGYDKNHIVNVPVNNLNLRNDYENLKSELIQYPRILDITASRELPSNIGLGGFGTRWEGKSEKKKRIVYRAFVNYNFIDFYGMELVKGRNFSKEFSSDKNNAFILNETAVKSFGWENPIGKSIGCFDSTGKRFNKGVVIGVIKDFHFLPLHRKIKALWLRVSTTQNNYLSIKISSKDIKASLAFLEEKFKELLPGYPFEYSFLDDRIKKMYKKEQRLGDIFNCFTFIAIFIASLGVLGLSSFIAEKRTKEIGIRKVLGASVRNIVYILSKRFLKLVILSSMIALPIAWFAMTKWLSNFAYKVNIGIGTFFTAVAMVLIITSLTISYQAIKAAKANPVDLLRYE